MTGQGGSHIASYDLASEVIPFYLYHILFNKSESLSEAALKEREIKHHLLKRLVSNNLWIYLKTVTVLIGVKSLFFFLLVVKVPQKTLLMDALKEESEIIYDFCMCNPPFFANQLEAKVKYLLL